MLTYIGSIAAVVLLAVGAVANAEETEDRVTQVHFRTVDRVLIVIPVLVNGAGPFNFILDTGAEMTAVDADLVHRLDLQSAGDGATLTTFTDQQTVSIVTAAVAISSIGSERLAMAVEKISAIPNLHEHLDGILGQNFLSRFNYRIDYVGHTVTIERGRGRHLHHDRDVQVPFERSGGKLLIRCFVQAGTTVELKLLIDSGADAIVLIHGTRLDAGLRNDSGFEKTVRANAVSVGSEQLRDIKVVVPVERAIHSGLRHDGVLPTSLFNSIYVNNEEDYIAIELRQ